MTATDITFNTGVSANEIAYATLSHIEDVARITLADVEEGGMDCEEIISSF